MTTKISGNQHTTIMNTPSTDSMHNNWLLKRLENQEDVSKLLPFFDKKLGDFQYSEIEDLWNSLVKPSTTKQLIKKDTEYSKERIDSDLCTVDCISVNSVTSVSPLNASVVWDFRHTSPPDIYSQEYWTFAKSLKEDLNTSSAKPIICVQLPHEKTRGMYWRMVFEKNIGTLFSLTSERDNQKQIGQGCLVSTPSIKPLEHGRHADEFWPLVEETCCFEDENIEVKQISFSGSETVPPPFEVLEFQVTEISTQNQKTVRMIRYQNWGDGSSPDTKQHLQQFHSLFKVIGLSGGCAINCRAGVGRSGTLAAYLIAKALEEAGTSLTLQLLVRIIEVLRKNRNFQMVQKNTQWRLLINALT